MHPYNSNNNTHCRCDVICNEGTEQEAAPTRSVNHGGREAMVVERKDYFYYLHVVLAFHSLLRRCRSCRRQTTEFGDALRHSCCSKTMGGCLLLLMTISLLFSNGVICTR